MSNWQVTKRLLILMRPWYGWMLLGTLLSLITIIANISLMALSGWFIATMAMAGISGASVNYFTPAAGIRGFAIARTASRYGERLVTHEATFRLLATLRTWFYEHLEPLAPAILQNYRSGDLLSRIRADIDALENFYLRILAPLLVAAITSLIILLFLLQFSTLLALIELVFLMIAGIVVPLFVNKLAQQASTRQIETNSELRSAVIDSTQGMSELLIYGAAVKQTERVNALSDQLLDDQQHLAKLNGGSASALGLCANLTMWLMLIVAIPMVTSGNLAPANLPMLALFALASFEAILPLPLAFQTLPGTLAAARRLFEIVDTKPAVIEPVTPAVMPERFDIEIDNASLCYPISQINALESISLSIPQGTHLAIVGPSGSGKSTLINALMRFWPIESGSIQLDGVNIEQFSGEDLRLQFAVATQQSTLFNSTIKRNLLLAKRDATDDEVVQACKLSQIHEFIESLPEGYETWIGEAGHKLSGGQIRRLGIARALLKPASVLILDEPGEGLDSVTEQKMLQAISENAKGKTLILITHHLVGLENMDQIVQLEQGHIVKDQ
ncbi:thiol reductant ABC exporter subunit CydC [Leucothrix arctica]|uniref:Thiol reductant ABC exporter subunit CydC n=1 Tax=Leucothrix arctica TaxID=1481894 RepID=A0A317C4Z8_9GAMM|nr:thiol reductant ABC exporter subunit CydC [Leucothrix arctica]PWQ93674.1 thiol reductant ABC exporter subunit CydC [Leucothrix arctica]